MATPPKIKKLNFPITRVKTIMKSSPDADTVSPDAIYFVAKSTEFFISYLTKEAIKNSKTKELDYKDIAAVVQSTDTLDFLCEIMPRKITVKQYKELMANREAERESNEDTETSEESDCEE